MASITRSISILTSAAALTSLIAASSVLGSGITSNVNVSATSMFSSGLSHQAPVAIAVDVAAVSEMDSRAGITRSTSMVVAAEVESILSRGYGEGTLVKTHANATTLSGLVFEPQVTVRSNASAASRIGVDGQGMLLRDAHDLVVDLLDGGCSCSSEIVEVINSALQEIYSKSFRLEFFNHVEIEAEFAADQSKAVLPNNVQRVVGDFRYNGGATIREVSTYSELRDFVEIYYNGQEPRTPRGAFVRAVTEQGFSDSVTLELHVEPKPREACKVTMSVCLEAPHVTMEMVNAGEPIPMPHRYVESLLLPLMKFWATSHRNFRKRDLLSSITAQYQTALTILGDVSPETKDRKASSNE